MARCWGHHPYKHSYPHCWRCHNPVIFRATEQWFIKMDQAAHGAKKTLRQEALEEEIHHVKWIPGWGEERIYEMIEKRPGLVRFAASASGVCRLSCFSAMRAASSSMILCHCATW